MREVEEMVMGVGYWVGRDGLVGERYWGRGEVALSRRAYFCDSCNYAYSYLISLSFFLSVNPNRVISSCASSNSFFTLLA